jgi:23S rRNA (adenine2503-C2)-methyltransferase
MKKIYSFTLEELKHFFIEKEQKPFRAEQVFDWVYQKRAASFNEMKNLSKDLRDSLEKELKFSSLELIKTLESKDGETFKFLWKLEDGHLIESVLILSNSRRTVCVSSQVGCKGACLFCASGKRGFIRNLSTDEIIEQIVRIDEYLKDKNERVSHVVFMGMGEPLENYENVVKSIAILNEPKGLNISQRKITISTVGIIEGIKKLLKENLSVNLTLSLHAPNQKIREKIMPAAMKNPFDELLLAMEDYFEKSGRDVTYEYILIENLNDQKEHAKELADNIKSHFNVNLIPYNPIDGVSLKRPAKEAIEAFKNELEKKDISVTWRYTKGKDIEAACGQLAFQETSTLE